ncbi:hypothetical protein EDD18DRAFT_1326901 [Armillaria luteobubalina]|uniref:F-box domain-containing protein n=1 Tax=Armillaria luteobubalina TaxID=153913 RepID=A0AA39UUR1_9AGAR|nr:hypothetical protein EDD18DRAFT_1326901 [Armillaria luteobubalina]
MAEECQRMRDLVQVRRAPLSAIRRLPPEVLTEIFRHTIKVTPPKRWISGPANELGHWEFQHKESPLWSIELVSRRWRDALLSHGKLWSNIIVQDVSKFKSTTPQELTREDSIPGELFAFLVMASPKIETLYLYLRPSMLTSFEPLKSAFRSLRTLNVLPNDLTDYPRLDAFEHAPNLRHNCRFYEFAFPWDQITVCKIVNWGVGRQFEPRYENITLLLSKMKRIVEFEISCLCDFTRRGTHSHNISVPVTCSQLASLKMSVVKTSASILLDVLLNDLVLPSLSSLDIDCQETKINAYNEPEQLFPALLELLRRFRCSLRELRFKHALVYTNDLLEVFQISPSLICLELINVGLDAITDDNLECLTLPSDSESESVTDSGTRGVEGGGKGRKMRWSTSATGNSGGIGYLRSVELGWVGWDPVYDPEDLTEILSYLEPCHSEGCQLKVYFGISDELLREYVYDEWM